MCGLLKGMTYFENLAPELAKSKILVYAGLENQQRIGENVVSWYGVQQGLGKVTQASVLMLKTLIRTTFFLNSIKVNHKHLRYIFNNALKKSRTLKKCPGY